MDASSAAPWSAELLSLLARNAPRLALARAAEPDARTRADTDARRRALAAVALEARLRVGLATRAKARQRVRPAAPVTAPPPPPPPPAEPPAQQHAANLRLVVNHEWGLAARARARAAALRRRPLTSAGDDMPGRWLASTSPGDDEFATLASHDGDEQLAASSEERSSDSAAPSEADDPVLEGNQPGDWPLQPGLDGLRERDADFVSTAEECSTGSVVEDAAGSDVAGSFEPATRAEFADAELQTDLYAAPDEALPAELSGGAASRRRREQPAFPEYDSRRVLLSRLRMQRSMRVTGGSWLGGADSPKRVLGGSASDPGAAGVGAAGIEHHAVEESPHDAVAAEPQEVAAPSPEDTQGASVLPTVGEPSHAVPLIDGDVRPTVDAQYAERFVLGLLLLLVREQSNGRMLDVRMELPLTLLDQLPADVRRAGSTDRMLFDCVNEALLLLTLGAEEVTVSLWHHRMTHLADASVLDPVCEALNRQLRAWLACAGVEDARERQQRHVKCDVAAGECTWAASIQRHTAELQAAADSR